MLKEKSSIDPSHHSSGLKTILPFIVRLLKAKLRHEESISSSSPTKICKNKLHHILGHVKGRSISEKQVIAVEKLKTEVEVERRRADDAVEQNTAITTKVAA